jgi:hypothetical protein
VRRLAKIVIVFLILSPLKEETLISKMNELKADFAPGSIFENCVPTADPLNVLNSVDIFQGISPEMIFVRFLFKVLTLVSRRCVEIGENGGDDFFVEEIAIFLTYCVHVFQSGKSLFIEIRQYFLVFSSGSHCKIAVYAISNVNVVQLEEISNNFLKMKDYPVLMFLWSYVLTLLNYNDKHFWTKVIDASTASPSINQKMMATGSVILFCDYMVSRT